MGMEAVLLIYLINKKNYFYLFQQNLSFVSGQLTAACLLRKDSTHETLDWEVSIRLCLACIQQVPVASPTHAARPT